jgi:Zn ribbon nucleic-acid-binding protein
MGRGSHDAGHLEAVLMRNLGTRALAIIFADSLVAQSNRIMQIIDMIDRGELDADTLGISVEDMSEAAEKTLDVVKVEPKKTTKPKPAPIEYDLEGLVPKPNRTQRIRGMLPAEVSPSARKCPACKKMDLRNQRIDGIQRNRCNTCGYIAIKRDEKCSCGETFKFAKHVVDGETIRYRLCKCGKSNLEGILRVREAKIRVEAKRAAEVAS